MSDERRDDRREPRRGDGDPRRDPLHGGGPNPGSTGNGGAKWSFDAWQDGITEEQVALQSDLSCLVDGELDEAAAARAMVRLEESDECRAFFDDIQRLARVHRDMSDPERLEARIAMLGVFGEDGLPSASAARETAEEIDLAHRLATIFYQLGKAYTLAALEPDAFRERVFEAAVPVEETRDRGRGFVDGVVESRDAEDEPGPRNRLPGRSIDWTRARHLLNGRLERISDPLEKGRRLLEQAIEVDPSHEEARIYLAFQLAKSGRSIKAAEAYRDVFDTGLDLANRGHAAAQLGRLYYHEGDLHRALVYWRWLTISGLADADPRFGYVRLNIAVAHLTRGDEERALDAFRLLLDRHMENNDGDVAGVVEMFAGNRDLRELVDSKDGFPEKLVAHCPELFRPVDPAEDDADGPSFPEGA